MKTNCPYCGRFMKKAEGYVWQCWNPIHDNQEKRMVLNFKKEDKWV